jgi:signal transduction histidine kinase
MPNLGEYLDGGARGHGWHGNFWLEHYLGRAPRNDRLSRAARLWLPVAVSIVLQVSGAFFLVRMANRHAVLVSVAPNHLLLTLAIAVLGPLVLIAARRYPGPVVAIIAAITLADFLIHRGSDGPPPIALAFALVSAIVRGARVWAWIAVSLGGVALLGAGLLLGISWQPIRTAGSTLGVLLVMGVGEAIRTRRERFAEISARFQRRKQTEVQAERVRIARELHDVLAHSLSQINVQAGVGLHLMDKHPEKAAEALASIKESSKTALDEVRSVLGVLRSEGGVDPSAPLVPEPELSRLPGLAASVTAQGPRVELRNLITVPPSSAIQLALYRIAQESLTNVLRHAAASVAVVTLAEVDGCYELCVQDDGRGPAAVQRDSGGRGVLGMSERAELLGGTLDAAAVPGGGFRVLARIPVAKTGVSE